MLKKTQFIVTLLLALGLFAFFITADWVYSQAPGKSGDEAPSIKQNAFSKPPFAIGQWVLYEININHLSNSTKNAKYLLKTSIVGSEKVKGEEYFWEEVSLVSEGLIIKSLKKPGSYQPKRAIFQRKGMPALEIDPLDISRQLNMAPENILPEIYQLSVKSSSKGLNPKNIITQTNTVVYSVSLTREELACRELVCNDVEKGGQIIVWLCEQIPLTGFCKLSYIGRDSIISIKLVNFGFKSAISEISGAILKFGDTSQKRNAE